MKNLSDQQWYKYNIKEVLQTLASTPSGILSVEVLQRRKKYGINQISVQQKNNGLRIFIRQFKDALILLLILSGIVSVLVNTEKPAESWAIFIIVFINVLIGFLQEYRAEKALQALSNMAPKKCIVKRDGHEQRIDVQDLVPGDVLILESGDKIGADARILESDELKIDESALTGESAAVEKYECKLRAHTSLADRKNSLYMGTLVRSGRAIAVVTEIGNRTEFGKIAQSLGKVEEEATPLQKKFAHLARQITYFAMVLIGLVFVVGTLKWNDSVGELLIFALVLAVGTVPSALPLIVTFSLSIGARHLAEIKLLLRKLPAAESMGSVDFICTDKTGTLTKNEMTVTQVYVGGQDIPVDGRGYTEKKRFHIDTPRLQADLEQLCRIAINCNNAHIVENKNRFEILGDAMEGALIVFAHKTGWKEKGDRKKEFPFDSSRKRMSVVMNDEHVFVKGAAEQLLPLCSHMQHEGEVILMTKEHKKKILDQQEKYGSQALRVLGFAYKKSGASTVTEAENNLIFSGLVGIQDPPREGVLQSIAECRKAGIQVMMITGDHLVTAKAIAHQIELLQPHQICVEGRVIHKWTDAELRSKVETIGVIARATPELKMRVVSILQQKKHVVAMTGDGINDAPALKKADVGLAMGITGTDVAKESAKGILLDDNFSTIVNAVKEGRNIYEKIIKSAKYLLSCNFSEISTVLITMVFLNQLPLQPLQILMINILTDTAPAAGLSMEKQEHDIMHRPPRNQSIPPITKEKLWMIFLFGGIMGIFTSFIFWISRPEGIIYAQTMAFTTLVIMQLSAVTSMRSHHASLRNLNLFSNPALLVGILFSIGLQLMVIYIPWAQNIMGTVALGGSEWILIGSMGIISYILFEVGKFFLPEYKHEPQPN